MISFDLPGVIEQTSKIVSAIDTSRGKSMVEYTGATRITPLTVVDRSLLALPELQDALQILASLDAAYQMMGIQLTVNQINGISIIRQLDKLNPTRGSAAKALPYVMSRENYTLRLPTGEPLPKLNLPDVGEYGTLGRESFSVKIKKNADKDDKGGKGGGEKVNTDKDTKDKDDNKGGGKTQNTAGNWGRNTVETIMQDTNLAVGKLMEVNVTANGHNFTIPVQVRLNTFTAAPKDIANIVANINPKQSAGEVESLHRAGLISLWDALTGKTAAKEWRKAAMEDKTGTIMRESNRRANNRKASFFSGTPSIGDISSIYVISRSTATEVEGVIGGKLSNFITREKMLENTGVMLLAIVDPGWKTVTIYHHSIDSESVYSFADLKRGGKSSNHDMGMVLEAFRQGQAPAKFF